MKPEDLVIVPFRFYRNVSEPTDCKLGTDISSDKVFKRICKKESLCGHQIHVFTETSSWPFTVCMWGFLGVLLHTLQSMGSSPDSKVGLGVLGSTCILDISFLVDLLYFNST